MKNVTIIKDAIGWRKNRTYRVADGVGNLLVERLKIAIDAAGADDKSVPVARRKRASKWD